MENAVLEYLTFDKFIATKLIVLIYYIFAVLVPFCLFFFKSKLFDRFLFLKDIETKALDLFSSFFTNSQKFKIYLSLFIMFLFFEIMLRIFFEILIAYFDIHDYLYKLTKIS
jgi:hypothetical protein